MQKKYTRNMVGYGKELPKVKWPNHAKLALKIVLKYEEGYEEGHERGYEDSQEYSLNKFKEERKTIYNKAFEEGRAYEAELDTEEFEKRQSGFDPRDYDEDYEK